MTGLRFGELAALQTGDMSKSDIRVRHSKSGKSRTVPLTGEGAKFFAKMIEGKAPHTLVFAPITRTHVARLMHKACTEADLSPPAVFHDLRRSYGGLLLNAGAEAEHIQELLGHAYLRMRRRAYAHGGEIASEGRKEAAELRLARLNGRDTRVPTAILDSNCNLQSRRTFQYSCYPESRQLAVSLSRL
jgi:integrase